MSVFASVLAFAAGFGIAALTLQIVLTVRHRLLGRRPVVPRLRTPGVSILKPLCGVDDDLTGNLESFARIDYPDEHLEILLGVPNKKDRAYPVALETARKWPKRFRVVVQNGSPGHNPKVNQLVTLYAAAKHDLLVVSDSNTRVQPHYVRELATAFENPRVGCVTSPIVGVGERKLGSLLDNYHLASSIGGGMIGSQLMPKQTIVVGKSMALRRSELEAIGGFESTCDVLAEDYVIGGKVQRTLKMKVHIAATPVENVSQNKRLTDFFQRYRRWSVIHRTAISLPVYLSQGLLNPMPIALTALALAPSIPMALYALSIISAKAILDVLHVAVLRPAPVGFRETLKLFAVTPLKDMLLFAAWMNGHVERTVVWRGKKLRVTSGSRLVTAPGMLTPVPPAAESAEGAPTSLSA